jgi:hypothetical protein
VAEKFEAMVTLGMANSRLKDFYDLWLIAQTSNLVGPRFLTPCSAHSSGAEQRCQLIFRLV